MKMYFKNLILVIFLLTFVFVKNADATIPAMGKVAYTTGDALWVMDADGTNQTKIATAPTGTEIIQPTWSKDGTKIAYVLLTRNGTSATATPKQSSIYVVNSDGSSNTQVVVAGDLGTVSGKTGWEYKSRLYLGPSFSPDGTMLSASYIEVFKFTKYGNSLDIGIIKIVVIPVSGGTPTVVDTYGEAPWDWLTGYVNKGSKGSLLPKLKERAYTTSWSLDNKIYYHKVYAATTRWGDPSSVELPDKTVKRTVIFWHPFILDNSQITISSGSFKGYLESGEWGNLLYGGIYEFIDTGATFEWKITFTLPDGEIWTNTFFLNDGKYMYFDNDSYSYDFIYRYDCSSQKVEYVRRGRSGPQISPGPRGNMLAEIYYSGVGELYPTLTPVDYQINLPHDCYVKFDTLDAIYLGWAREGGPLSFTTATYNSTAQTYEYKIGYIDLERDEITYWNVDNNPRDATFAPSGYYYVQAKIKGGSAEITEEDATSNSFKSKKFQSSYLDFLSQYAVAKIGDIKGTIKLGYELSKGNIWWENLTQTDINNDQTKAYLTPNYVIDIPTGDNEVTMYIKTKYDISTHKYIVKKVKLLPGTTMAINSCFKLTKQEKNDFDTINEEKGSVIDNIANTIEANKIYLDSVKEGLSKLEDELKLWRSSLTSKFQLKGGSDSLITRRIDHIDEVLEKVEQAKGICEFVEWIEKFFDFWKKIRAITGQEQMKQMFLEYFNWATEPVTDAEFGAPVGKYRKLKAGFYQTNDFSKGLLSAICWTFCAGNTTCHPGEITVYHYDKNNQTLKFYKNGVDAYGNPIGTPTTMTWDDIQREWLQWDKKAVIEYVLAPTAELIVDIAKELYHYPGWAEDMETLYENGKFIKQILLDKSANLTVKMKKTSTTGSKSKLLSSVSDIYDTEPFAIKLVRDNSAVLINNNTPTELNILTDAYGCAQASSKGGDPTLVNSTGASRYTLTEFDGIMGFGGPFFPDHYVYKPYIVYVEPNSLTNISPTNPTIYVVFSAPMDKTNTLTDASVKIDTTSISLTNATWDDDGYTLTITTSLTLNSGTTYTLFLDFPNGKDVNGTTLSKTTYNTPFSTTSVITTSGGNVTIGKVTISIPANALTTPQEIKISTTTPDIDIPSGYYVYDYIYDITPSGLNFNQPVTITLPVEIDLTSSGMSATIVTIENNAWKNLGGTLSGDKKWISVQVNHFSIYAVFYYSWEAPPSNIVNFNLLKDVYYMITIPMDVGKTFSEIFGQDIFVWKYDTTTGNYNQANLTDMPEIGKGYFIQVISDKNISVGGTPTTSGDITLKNGWNLVGSPFNYDILWSETKVGQDTIDDAHKKGLVASYAWTYDTNSGQFKLVFTDPAKLLDRQGVLNKLEARRGYWLLSTGDYTITISSTPAPAKSKGEPYQISDDNFSIRISAKVKNITDSENYCGITKYANLYKIKEPPRFKENEYISLYFIGDGEKRAVDFRAQEHKSTSYQFEFEVETDILNSDITINIDTGNLPKGYRVKLIDKDIGAQDNKSTSYTYNSGNEKIRKFKLIVEKPLVEITQDKGLNLEQVYTYPNPYKAGTSGKGLGTSGITFRYRAGGNISRVVIEIYNLAGRLIDRFEDETVDGEVNWSFAEKLANGVYIYRITISDGVDKKTKTGKIVILK